MANGRFAQQISAIATGRLLLRSVRQKRMMCARPRSRMFFCNVVSGWEDAEWKRNFRIGRPTIYLLVLLQGLYLFAALREFVPDFSSSSVIFRYGTLFLVIPRSCACIPSSFYNSSSFAVSLSPHMHPRSAIFNPLFALKPVSNPSPVRGLLTLKRQKYGLYTDGESYHRTVASCGCDRC